MNSMKLVVGFLFLVLASKTCALTKAQDMEPPSEASVRQAGPPEHRVFLSAARGENANHVGPDDRFQRALNGTVPVSDPAATAREQVQFTAPTNTEPQDDCLEGECPSLCNDPCPCFYGRIEALFFMRNPRFARQPIVVDPNSDRTFLSTSDLAPNFSPGLWATFGMRLCGGRALEFDYFGFFDGTTSAVAVQPNLDAFLTFPGNLSGNVFVDMDRVQVGYNSSLQSVAINFPCCCGCCDECGDECGGECGRSEIRCRSFEWFGGFRYLNLGDRLNIAAQRTVSGGLEEGSYNIRTTNQLYGAQLGARLRRTRNRFGWEAFGAGGIFGNDAQQTQTVTDFPNFPLRPTVSSSKAGVAFVGIANLSALYLLTDVWNLRVGYSAIWIEGLALAPDQLDFNFAQAPSGNQLHNGGGLLLHGVNVGIEARW